MIKETKSDWTHFFTVVYNKQYGISIGLISVLCCLIISALVTYKVIGMWTHTHYVILIMLFGIWADSARFNHKYYRDEEEEDFSDLTQISEESLEKVWDEEYDMELSDDTKQILAQRMQEVREGKVLTEEEMKEKILKGHSATKMMLKEIEEESD